MSLQEARAELFAELFQTYQRELVANSRNSLAGPACNDRRVMPTPEKDLIIAAARRAWLDIDSLPSETESRRYFAKPGGAEWGC